MDGQPAAAEPAVKPTGPNEPPRSDQPSTAPLQVQTPEGGTGLGVSIVGAPAADPNAVVKPVGPDNTVVPAAEAPAAAPDQINDIRPGTGVATQPTATTSKKKKAPKPDLSDESSSKKKKKKGLGKINPF